MRIRMIKLAAGPDGVRRPGELFEVNDTEAQALIGGGSAEPFDDKEAAALGTPENAALGAGRPPFRHKGGGWYELADGTRVKGKKAALKASGA